MKIIIITLYLLAALFIIFTVITKNYIFGIIAIMYIANLIEEESETNNKIQLHMNTLIAMLYLLASLLIVVTILTKYYIFGILAMIIYFVSILLSIAELINKTEKNNKVL